MNDSEQTIQRLFSYGTLQQRDVQLATFGRELIGQSDALLGYLLTEVCIEDEQVIALSGKRYHPMLMFTGNIQDEVHGTVFELTIDELLQADGYEVAAYRRKLASLRSGGFTWIYANATED